MTSTISAFGTPSTENALLRDLNHNYMQSHFGKEDAFWKEKMDLSSKVPGDFEKLEIAHQKFIADPKYLPQLRQELQRQDLSDEDKTGLEGWLRFFTVNAMENPEASILANKIIKMEGQLQAARQGMKLGFVDPTSHEFVAASSVKLGLMIRTSPEEAMRKAAHQGLLSIEKEVLSKGFLEIVSERNKLGRMLGYEDYYDFKVSRNEGFSKKVLFEILSDLEVKTRKACKDSIDKLAADKGPGAREGYNFLFLTSGDVTKQMDPYFGFESALSRWGKSFSALGIRYRGATLTLDLLDRKGKYENGFMHGPIPGYGKLGSYAPAKINFTANAIPGQVGSGHRATETLFHEGGHAAHFSNILMPAPCFAQEYAPTSVAFAETQSMFLDSFIETPDWLVKYALDKNGNPIPLSLIRESIIQKQPFKAFALRSMLTVCFAEKAIYEMSEAELTPENVVKTIRRIEKEFLFLNQGTRPVLSVPHLLAGESSAYYHGYVLAEMAVHQTRRFFLKRDGKLIDNPKVGRDLAEYYWKEGNKKTFLAMVQELTGEPFGADATVEMVSKTIDQALSEAEGAFTEAATENKTTRNQADAPIDLEATIRLVHGDELIATNENGQTFESMDLAFTAWLSERG